MSLYLPGVETIVCTVDRPHCIARHPHVTEILGSRGFVDWSFFWGTPGTPYWEPIRREYAALLRDHDPPLLILENDIGVYEFNSAIDPPPGCQVAYLGGGTRQLPEATRTMIDGSWMRIAGMLYAHAILWLCRRAMLEAAEAMESARQPHDVTLAQNQSRWFIACLRRPAFFQNDSCHAAETQNYE